jgi:hypothetical protein
MAYSDLDQGEKFLYDSYYGLAGEFMSSLYTLAFLADDDLLALLALKYPFEVNAVMQQRIDKQHFWKIIEKCEAGAKRSEIPHYNLPFTTHEKQTVPHHRP